MAEIDKVRQILETVTAIPAGTVATYGQIADLAGLPGRARLVGSSLKREFDGLCVPWHRVLRADGKIAFPEGTPQANEQRQLLLAENVTVKKNKVSLKVYLWQPDLETILCTLKY